MKKSVLTRQTIIQAVIILGLALVFATASAFFHPKRPAWYLVEIYDPMALPPAELRVRLGDQLDSVLWVDARKTAQFEKEHMPGAIVLNNEDWEILIEKYISKLASAMGKPIVVYCDRRCERSKVIAEKLRQTVGLNPVYVLKGDWREWSK